MNTKENIGNRETEELTLLEISNDLHLTQKIGRGRYRHLEGLIRETEKVIDDESTEYLQQYYDIPDQSPIKYYSCDVRVKDLDLCRMLKKFEPGRTTILNLLDLPKKGTIKSQGCNQYVTFNPAKYNHKIVSVMGIRDHYRATIHNESVFRDDSITGETIEDIAAEISLKLSRLSTPDSPCRKDV